MIMHFHSIESPHATEYHVFLLYTLRYTPNADYVMRINCCPRFIIGWIRGESQTVVLRAECTRRPCLEISLARFCYFLPFRSTYWNRSGRIWARSSRDSWPRRLLSCRGQGRVGVCSVICLHYCVHLSALCVHYAGR